MRVIAVYPGRFQPFGLHHFMAFKWLQQKFGIDNCFIATSDKTEPDRSPFSFNDKTQIISKYGINSDKIAKTSRPYAPIELLTKFDKNTTSVVYLVGEKDKERFTETKSTPGQLYFKKYEESIDLLPYSKNSYILTSPHFNAKIGTNEMSGTSIRSWLKKTTPSDFQRTMGWFNPGTFKMMKDRVLSEGLKKSNLLTEGGAAGHMSHIIDDMNMTFGNLKEIIKRALTGKLNAESKVTEKTDGINLFITYKDGKVLVARNKQTIINPVSIDVINQKYELDTPEVANAFKYATTDMEAALNKINSGTLFDLFKNGLTFANIEIVYPNANQTMKYGNAPFIQINNLVEFDQAGNKIKEYPDGGLTLKQLFDDVNAHTQSKFKIIPPKEIEIKPDPNYKEKIGIYNNQIKRLQNEYKLSDANTIGDYYINWWKQFITRKFKIVDEQILIGLAKRWAIDDKEFRLNSKTIVDKNLLNAVQEFDKNESHKFQKGLIKIFETLIMKMSVDVIDNATNFLSTNPSAQVQDIRKKLKYAINNIRQTNDPAELSRLSDMVSKLNAAGGIDKISPLEGVVFTYNGKQYKLTGTYSPINQILGIVKFRKN